MEWKHKIHVTPVLVLGGSLRYFSSCRALFFERASISRTAGATADIFDVMCSTVCIYCFYSSQECLWAITDLFPQCSFNLLFRTVMLFLQFINSLRLNKVLKPYRWRFSTSRVYLVLNPLYGKALARFCTHFPFYYVGSCMVSYLSNLYEMLRLILGSF